MIEIQQFANCNPTNNRPNKCKNQFISVHFNIIALTQKEIQQNVYALNWYNSKEIWYNIIFE